MQLGLAPPSLDLTFLTHFQEVSVSVEELLAAKCFDEVPGDGRWVTRSQVFKEANTSIVAAF